MINGRSWRLWAFVGGFALTVAMFLVARACSNFPGDEWLLKASQRIEADWLDALALGLDEMGEVPVLPAVLGGSIWALFAARRWVESLMIVASLPFMVAGQFLKVAVGRARPDEMLAAAESAGFGFPSGHSVYAMLFGGLMIFIAGGLIRNLWARRFVQGFVALWVVTTGASRVYLGVHWPSDVVGGFMFGAISLTLIIAVRNTSNAKRW